MPRRDRTGERFGRLVVQRKEKLPGWGTRWLCLCDCGREKLVLGSNLDKGNTKSCGCLHDEVRRTHQMSKSDIYAIWKSMRQRCNNSRAAGFENYGGRGIKVFPEWEIRFESFRDYIGPRPSKGHTLDRINNDGNYEPGNVKWATWQEQHANKRTTTNLTAFGKTQPLARWAEEYGINLRTLHNRIYRCRVPLEKALTAPIHQGRKI